MKDFGVKTATTLCHGYAPPYALSVGAHFSRALHRPITCAGNASWMLFHSIRRVRRSSMPVSFDAAFIS
jgi:hypothetical protein